LNEVGRVALAQKDFDRAIAEFTRTLQADPKYKWAYLNRGYASREKGDLDKALVDLAETVRLDPHYAWAWNLRGRALFQKGDPTKAANDWEKAIAEYTRSISTSPHESWPSQGLAWLLATCPIERLRDGSRAIGLALKACELTKWKDANCIGTLAGAYAEVGQFNKAIEHQTRALDMNMPGYDRAAAQRRLKGYRQREPHREPPIPTASPTSSLPVLGASTVALLSSQVHAPLLATAALLPRKSAVSQK
jgi:tetratricopeptide (TPR) repeat protein